jgi:hypothetical protein
MSAVVNTNLTPTPVEWESFAPDRYASVVDIHVILRRAGRPCGCAVPGTSTPPTSRVQRPLERGANVLLTAIREMREERASPPRLRAIHLSAASRHGPGPDRCGHPIDGRHDAGGEDLHRLCAVRTRAADGSRRGRVQGGRGIGGDQQRPAVLPRVERTMTVGARERPRAWLWPADVRWTADPRQRPGLHRQGHALPVVLPQDRPRYRRGGIRRPRPASGSTLAAVPANVGHQAARAFTALHGPVPGPRS